MAEVYWPGLPEEISLARHDELLRRAVAASVDAADDRGGDAARLAHHELGRARDLVGHRDLGLVELATARVVLPAEIANGCEPGDA